MTDNKPFPTDYLKSKIYAEHAAAILAFTNYYGMKLFADRDIWNQFEALVRYNHRSNSDDSFSAPLIHQPMIPFATTLVPSKESGDLIHFQSYQVTEDTPPAICADGSVRNCRHDRGWSVDLDSKITKCNVCKHVFPIKDDDVVKLRESFAKGNFKPIISSYNRCNVNPDGTPYPQIELDQTLFDYGESPAGPYMSSSTPEQIQHNIENAAQIQQLAAELNQSKCEHVVASFGICLKCQKDMYVK